MVLVFARQAGLVMIAKQNVSLTPKTPAVAMDAVWMMDPATAETPTEMTLAGAEAFATSNAGELSTVSPAMAMACVLQMVPANVMMDIEGMVVSCRARASYPTQIRSTQMISPKCLFAMEGESAHLLRAPRHPVFVRLVMLALIAAYRAKD